MADAIAGYRLEELLFTSGKSAIYRGRRDGDGQVAIIKLLNQEYPPPDQLARFRREFAITSGLALDGVIRAYSLEKHDNTLAMVLEDFGGQDLGKVARSGGLPVERFLPLALRIVDILDAVHRRKILHKDINPSNILWNESTGEVRLIDFGISSELSMERAHMTSLNVLEGTLPYMAPEQNGRMNRAMDYRTDFYSLGATFYHLVTGQQPFAATDPLELVHCHLARMPKAPHEINPRIPPALSGIILKLMAKAAEERYQSAYGLKADLESCVDRPGTEGATFALGQHDISDRFHIPQKLYGREADIGTLLTTFDHTSRGATELLLIAGYSGVGKTSLIEEVHKPLLGRKGYFISGKFDQFRRDIPYASIVNAFQDLIRQLLSERTQKIWQWKSRLLEALGAFAQIIVETIPELEAIIGPQPPVLEVGGKEAERRFNETFAKFAGVFCQEEHPTILFLDDLQWADPVSLKLIQLLMTDPGMHHLLIVGTYRDNEVAPSHPLMLAVEEIQKAKPVQTIYLKPLSLDDTFNLVADTVQRLDREVNELAAMIYRKTKGNPFFINRLLTALYDGGQLRFDHGSRRWTWDTKNIQEMQVSDNVVELMVSQLRQLPVEAQSFLQLASCFGNQFSARMIARVNGQPLHTVIGALSRAIEEDFVAPIGTHLSYAPWSSEPDEEAAFGAGDYRFCHDRIHEAAYSQLSPSEKLETHRRIGFFMLAEMSEEELDDRLFDVIDHLNKAVELVTDTEERLRLARLNLKAARKARASMAKAAALAYFDKGIALLSESGWQREHETVYALHYHKTECEFLCGHLEESERTFKTTIANARSRIEMLKVYELMMRIHLTSNKFNEGLRLGREALILYDIPLPFDNPDAMQALADRQVEDVEDRMAGRDLQALLDAPLHADEELSYGFAILFRVWTLGFLGGNLAAMNYAGMKMVSLTLQNGNDKYSSFGYIVFAMNMVAKSENYAHAYALGMLAMDMNRKFGNVAAVPPINNLFGHIISHYNMHYSRIPPIFQESYEASLQSGEVEWGVWASNFVYLCAFIQGRPLDTVSPIIDKFLGFVRQAGSESILHMMQFHRNLVSNLRGETASAESIDTESYNEATLIEYLTNSHFEYGWLWYYLYRSVLFYLYGDYEKALEYSRKAEIKKVFAPAFMKFAEQHFYHPLILAANYRSLPEDEQAQAIRTIESCRDRLLTWAASCPDNYRHKHLLVSAELARLRDEGLDAERLYDAAIRSAREHEFLQDEALGNELAARFFLERGLEKAAIGYLIEARYLYERWGALRKVAALDARFPMLARRQASSIDNARTTETGPAALDLVAIVHTSQALSAEVGLGRVLERLMRIVQENAGAQNARLLLRGTEDRRAAAPANAGGDRPDPADSMSSLTGEWLLEADLSGSSIAVLQSQPVSLDAPEHDLFPLPLLRYVARLAEEPVDEGRRPATSGTSQGANSEDTVRAGPVVIDDLSVDSAYRLDPYVIATRPRSILCVPIHNRSRLIGILYLENNLATGVFNPQRVELLKLISSQIAISIENARLYNGLEAQVAERTAQMRLAKEEAEGAEARVADLLDHSGQGFLSFGGDLVVDPEYSRACVAMLGEAPVGKDAATVLFGDDRPGADLLRLGANAVFDEPDTYQRATLLSLFPAEIRRGARILKAAYTVLDNGHIMTVLTDVTEERRLEEEVRKEHRGLRMVVSAVTESRDFFEAATSFRHYLDVELPGLLGSEGDTGDKLERIYRDVHTFKGTLNQFRFLHSPEALHALEEDLGNLRWASGGVTSDDIARCVAAAPLTEMFEKDLAGLERTLGSDFVRCGERVTLTADQAVRLERLASGLLRGESVDAAASDVHNLLLDVSHLRRVPLRKLLAGYDRLIAQIAGRLEKEIAPIRIDGGEDVWIDPLHYGSLSRTLAHLFRNAVAHGIETPEERVLAGKGEVGRIFCSVGHSGSLVTIVVEDDGAGIDVKTVRRRAVDAGVIDAAAEGRLTDADALDLVFMGGITTKAVADQLSGRGEGLSAVRAQVGRLGGSVTVESKRGEGTRFLIHLPTPVMAL